MTARVGVIGLGVIGKPIALYISTQASLIADSGHATGREDPRF